MTMTSAIHRPLTRTRFGSSASAVDNHSAAPTGVLAGFMEWVIFGFRVPTAGRDCISPCAVSLGAGGRFAMPVDATSPWSLRPIGATDPAAICRPWECGFESRLGAYLRLVRITAIPAA